MSFPFAHQKSGGAATGSGTRHIALVCAKGGLDECYPVLIMANAARMSGIKVSVFFTFWGLDVISEGHIDNLFVNMVGNPSSPIPPAIAGLPGMETIATSFMRSKMDSLDIPRPREMIEMLAASGCELYGCELAMKMFERTKEDLVPQVSEVITATEFFEKTGGADIVFV